MSAKTDCTLLLLDTEKFQKTACQFLTRQANPIHYGKGIIKSLNNSDWEDLTDLEDPMLDLDELAVEAFDCRSLPRHVGPRGHGPQRRACAMSVTSSESSMSKT